MSDFLDTYAAELEKSEPRHTSACVRPVISDGTGDGWQCIPTCAVRIHKAAFIANHRRESQAEHERLIADGTGRHSRRDMDAALDELVSAAALRASYERTLDVLQQLLRVLPERWEHEFATDGRRVLAALNAARGLLVEAGR